MPISRSMRAQFSLPAGLAAAWSRAVAGDPPDGGTVTGMRVAVLDDYHRIAHTLADWASLGVEVAFFDKPLAPEQLPHVLADFDTLVLMRERTAFPRELLEHLPNLRLVITTGMRNASLDVDYLRDRGVRVCGTGIPGYSSRTGWVRARLRRPACRARSSWPGR